MRLLMTMLAILTLLGGCRLTSDKPLLDRADATTPFAGDVFLVGLGEEDTLALDKNGAIEGYAFEKKDNHYVANGGADEAFLSFHPLPGRDGLLLLQFTSGKGTVYGLTRPMPTLMPVKTIALAPKMREALQTLGYNLEDVQSETKAMDREALMVAVEAFIKANADKLADFSRGDVNYRVATGEAQGKVLIAEMLNTRCLAYAGHPADPEVRRLSAPFSTGRTLEDIDVPSALKLCDTAMDFTPSDSARYAYSRTLRRAERYDEMEQLLSALRDAGFALAYAMSAENLVRGIGVEQDRAAGRRLLEDHADDYAIVRYYLGAFHLYGMFGGDPDYTTAARLMKSAMKDGFAPAYVDYARMQQGGLGMTKDAPAAFRNFEAGAEAGVGAGLMEAGRALYFGTGTEQDYKAAYVHLEEATKHRIAEAYYMTGFMRSRGQGTTKDLKKAVAFFEKGAAKDNAFAKGELGRALVLGLGTDIDRPRGLTLLREAIAAGDASAKTYLDGIEKPLSAVSGIPAGQKRNLERAVDGKTFELTNANIPFMAGVASALMSNCGNPKNMAERAELAKFTGVAATAMIFGGDYSNRDLGKSMSSVAERNALQIVGTKVGAQIPCGAVSEKLAQGMLKAIRSNSQGADGGESNFVSSCQRQFTARQCQCIADAGRVVIPDIHRQHYHRSLIKEMIQRNPMLGLTVGFGCGVSNY